MDSTTFNEFRQIVYDRSGIALNESKEALVRARLGKRMRALGMEDYREYLRHVTQDTTGEEIVHMLDAISTNVTHFFREADHFAFLSEAFTGWLGQGQRRFRFWSAACSTGEEPYSLALTLLDATNGHSADLKVLATDISTRALDICRRGEYPDEKTKDIPPSLRERYFERGGARTDPTYSVRAEAREIVVPKRLNLSKPPFPMHGPMDAVFCRNVMIYFDNTVRKRLLDEMYRLLKPGGFLFVGHAESLTGMMSEFKAVKPSIYVKQRLGLDR